MENRQRELIAQLNRLWSVNELVSELTKVSEDNRFGCVAADKDFERLCEDRALERDEMVVRLAKEQGITDDILGYKIEHQLLLVRTMRRIEAIYPNEEAQIEFFNEKLKMTGAAGEIISSSSCSYSFSVMSPDSKMKDLLWRCGFEVYSDGRSSTLDCKSRERADRDCTLDMRVAHI